MASSEQDRSEAAYVTTFVALMGFPGGRAYATLHQPLAMGPQVNFSNEPVDIAQLPAWQAVALQPVAPVFARYRLLATLFNGAVLTAAVAFAPLPERVPGVGEPWLIAAVAGVFLVAAITGWLEARRRGWALRSHDLIYRFGLIVQTTAVLPLIRVQHVETASGPLERACGLVRLNCYTAGGAGADLVVAGLDRATAERVRHYLLDRLHADGDPAAMAADDDPA